MGDRGNVYITDADVFLYSHWGGYHLAMHVRDALKRAPDRWSDAQYLARVIFCEMVRGDVDGTAGYGISHTIGDNGNPLIIVNPNVGCVSVVTDRKKADEGDTSDSKRHVAFRDFITWDEDKCRRWHHGSVEEVNHG